MAAGEPPVVNVPMSPGDLVPRPDPTVLTAAAVSQVKDDLRREISQLKEILEARMGAMDKATILLAETVNRAPTELQTEISYLRQLFEAKITGHDELSHSWREAIEQRFADLDARFTQQQTTSRDALDAALRAARELGDLQNKANALANAKTEESVAQQLQALTDKVAVNATRLDRGEGMTSGAQGYRTERRLDYGTIIGALAALIALAALFVVAFKK